MAAAGHRTSRSSSAEDATMRSAHQGRICIAVPLPAEMLPPSGSTALELLRAATVLDLSATDIVALGQPLVTTECREQRGVTTMLVLPSSRRVPEQT
ncbi:hypothetical protein ACP70R_022093 [Stipagrostis hirtigluma subsp. patula]